MSKFLYLECLDCKEKSRPVGVITHPDVIEDIRNQWVSGFIAPHVIAKLGLQFGPSDIYTRDTLFRNDPNRYQSQHQQCERHVLIRNPAGIDVLVRTPDWACHQEGCDEPVTHGYFSKRFPGLGDILACRDHGLGMLMTHESIYSTDWLVHLAIGEYSIFRDNVKKRRVDKGV